MPVMTLAEKAGPPDLVAEHVGVPGSPGANAGLKVATLVAGMVAGAASIEDMDLARHAPSDHVGAIVLGMGGHVANSMMLGVAFALLMATLVTSRGVIAPLVLGTMFGVAVWVIMRYLILPFNDGTADLFTGATVSPQWMWYLAHAVFGMTLGLIYAHYQTATTPAHTSV